MKPTTHLTLQSMTKVIVQIIIPMDIIPPEVVTERLKFKKKITTEILVGTNSSNNNNGDNV